MLTLKNPLGDILTLVFSGVALSSAKLNGKNATKRLRFLRPDNCAIELSKYGFTEAETASDSVAFTHISKQLKSKGVYLVTASWLSRTVVSLFLSTDSHVDCFSSPESCVLFSMPAMKFIEFTWTSSAYVKKGLSDLSALNTLF